ncbi:TfoX/Sxy family DNA transformation protein [Pelagovum pacificum]|uniref:Competence protein TfoX n=1 Tax=Pelagovum pacificum TaxID=2588711 RepID=A0A5C5GB93_9RHOB|nr:TfoX/Sxy family DNA transformation protein [Pelagovum pacificum]QQA41377.1 TfoX/Sxy family DNA transformation protein [Pelagovum pacificum]TNY31820.1 competence protein TfoX [Pelagovum pacificum]
MSDITSIPDLGPATARSFERAGVTTAEEIRALGPDTAYARLLSSGVRPHFIAYYSLVMGLQGRPWNDAKGAEKSSLRKRFDALCRDTSSSPQSELDRFLDEIGVRPSGSM